MKKIIALAFITFLVSCGNSEKASDTPKKVLVCDSVKESFFDSAGVEQVNTVLRCDSVLEEKK